MTIDLVLKIARNNQHFLSLTGHVLISCDLKFVTDYRILGQLRDMSAWWETDVEIPAEPTIRSHALPRGIQFPINDDEAGEVLVRGGPSFEEESTFLYASELRALTYPPDAAPWNLAIKAFIEALPDDTPIILYWE